MNVNGYVRMGDDARGDVILMTHFGLITVSGSKLNFEDVLGDVFSRAGFDVAPSGAGRRRLAGFFELQAMFNDVTSWEAADGSAVGDDFVPPSFPENYEVDVTVLYRCDTTFKIPGRVAAGIGNTGEKAVRRDYIMYDGRRCHYPGTKHSTVVLGGADQEFQKVHAHMIISNELKLAREVYYPSALSDRHAIVRLKNSTHDSVRYMLDFQDEGRAAVTAGTEERGLFCDASGTLDDGDATLAGNPNLKFLYAGDTSLPKSASESIGMIQDVRMFKVEDAESGRTIARLYDRRQTSGVYMPLRMDVHNGMDDIIFEFGEFKDVDAATIEALVSGPAICMNDTETTVWGSETKAVAPEEKALSYYPFRGYNALFEYGGTEDISSTDAYQIYRLRTAGNVSSFVADKAKKRNLKLVEEMNKEVEDNTTGVGGDQPGSLLYLYGDQNDNSALQRKARHLQKASNGGTVTLSDPEEIHGLAAAIKEDAEAGLITHLAGGERRLQGFGIGFDYSISIPAISFTHCKAAAEHEIALKVELGVIEVEVAIEIGDMWLQPFQELQSNVMIDDESGSSADRAREHLDGPFSLLQAGQWPSIAVIAMIWDMFHWGWFDEVWVMALLWFLNPLGMAVFTPMLAKISTAYTGGVTDLQQYMIDERASFEAEEESKYPDSAKDAVDAVISFAGPLLATLVSDGARALIAIFHFAMKPTLSVGHPFSRACSITIQPLVTGFFGIISVGGSYNFDANPYLDPETMFDAFDGETAVDNAGWEIEGCIIAALDPLGPAKVLPGIGEWFEEIDSSLEINLCVAFGIDDGTVLKEHEMWNEEYYPAELKDRLAFEKDNGDTGYCPGLARPYIQATAAMPWDFELSIFGFEIFSLKMNIQATLNYFFIADKRCAKWLCDHKYEPVWLAVEEKKEEANEMITAVTVDLTQQASTARSRADDEEAKANGMKQIVAAGEWVKSMLDKGLDMLDLDWDDFEVDFYKMDSITVKAVAMGARLALEGLATILETEQNILEKSGGALKQCNAGNLMDCLGSALDVGAELAEIASILTMEMDCDRYAKQKALGFNPGATEAEADLNVLDQGLLGLDWLPFTPRQVIDEIENMVRLVLQPALNVCIGPDLTEKVPIVPDLSRVELSSTLQMCLVHEKEDFRLDRRRLATIFQLLNELNPFDEIWDAVKGYVNGLARETYYAATNWIREQVPAWCPFDVCFQTVVNDIINTVPYQDPVHRKLMSEQHHETGSVIFTPVNASGYVSPDVEHVLRHARRRMDETGGRPHLHDILYAAHQFHGLEYDYAGVHSKIEEATLVALEKEVKRRVMIEDVDFSSLDSFFLVEDFEIKVTATELFEFKMIADGFGVRTGDLMQDVFGSNSILEVAKQVPIYTAVAVKIVFKVELFMPYTFAIFTAEKTQLTVRASWKDAFLKLNLMTGQFSGDLGSMEDTGIFYEGQIVSHSMQQTWLAVTAEIGICVLTLCFDLSAEAVMPKFTLGASSLIAQAGLVYPGVIRSFQPLDPSYKYSSFDIQKIKDIADNGAGVLAAGMYTMVSWPEFELKLTIPEELYLMSASLPAMSFGLLPDVVAMASLFGIVKGTTIRLVAVRDSKMYFGWTVIADFEELIEEWFGSDYDYGIGEFISSKNLLATTVMFETSTYISDADDGRFTKMIPAFPDFALPAFYNKERGDPTDLDFEFEDSSHRHLQQMSELKRGLKQLVPFENELPEDVQAKLAELRGKTDPAPALKEDAWFSTEGCRMCEGCKVLAGEALALTGGKDGHPEKRCVKAAGGQLELYNIQNERREDGRYESTFHLRGGAENRFCRLAGTHVLCDMTDYDQGTKFSLQDRGDGKGYMKVWSHDDEFDYNPSDAKNDYLTGVEHTADWWISLDHAGWSTCGDNRVMAGFFRNGCDSLGCLEEGKCANFRNPSSSFSTSTGGHAMGNMGWHLCPAGQFMDGIQRNNPCWQDCQWWGCQTHCDHDLSNLVQMSCRGVNGVNDYSHCYEEHGVSNGHGTFLCQHGYGLAGFERVWNVFKHKLNNIEKFKCCKIESMDSAPSYCAPDGNGELYCGYNTPPETTAVMSPMDGVDAVLSMGGIDNVHVPNTVCGIASNGGTRCTFSGPKDIDRQLYVADNCNAPSKFSIDAPSGGFGPLLLNDGAEEAADMMCVDCTSEQACHAAKRGTATCTEFKVDAPEGETLVEDLKHRLLTRDGLCLDCPWATVYQSGDGAFKFNNDQGYGGDRECRLSHCYRDIARYAVGMTFKQRMDTFSGTDAGTPEPNRLCSTKDGAGALFGECEKYAEMCVTHETHHAYCELKKTDFIEETLKPTIAKVANHWEKLSVEAEANLDAADGSRQHALGLDRKLDNQKAFLLDSIGVLNELVSSVTTRHKNCLTLNYPKALLLTFEFTMRFCIIGFCFEKDPTRIPFIVPMGDDTEDLSERTGGGSESVEKYVDDLLYGLHEANQDEQGMDEILDATFNFDDIDNTMPAVYHESECFDVSSTDYGIDTLDLLQATCDIDVGQALNRFGIKRDEEQCGTGRGVVWWSCVNALKDAPGVCTWSSYGLGPAAFAGQLSTFVFNLQCPDGTLVSRIAGSSSDRVVNYQCCTAIVQYQGDPTNCVTVEPAWPGGACSAESPVGSSTSLATFGMYEPRCDREPAMLDWQKTGGRVAMTSYKAAQVNCGNGNGLSTKVAVTCCKVLSSRSAGFDKLKSMGAIVWEFTAYVSYVWLNDDLGEVGSEDIFFIWMKNSDVTTAKRVDMPLVTDVEEDYFTMQPLGSVSPEDEDKFIVQKFSETDTFVIDMWEDDPSYDDHVARKTFTVGDVAKKCQSEDTKSDLNCCAYGEYGRFCVLVIPNVKGLRRAAMA